MDQINIFMTNLILFGLGVALLCGMGLLFATNATRHARERRKLKSADSDD